MMQVQIPKGIFQKKIFSNTLLILVFILMAMPFVTTFNNVLTHLVMELDFYKVIENVVVPWEVRMVGVILWPFGFRPSVVGEYLAIGINSPLLIEIAWNCIGWQSFVIFIITTAVGLQGDYYSNMSKLKALIIGLLGTFLVNLVRIAMVAVVAWYFGQNVTIIIHDYGSTIINIVWLLFYWWFSYRFVLEEKIWISNQS